MGFVGLPGAAYNTFSPGLWPSEAAWKLRCEIALTAGFAPGETFTFKNAPMGGPESTNRLGWSTNREGLSVTLDGFSFPGRRQGHLPSGAPSFQTLQADLSVRGLPSGENLDLVEAYADSTNRVQGFMSRRDNHWTCTFHLFRVQAHNLDMTFAIHRSRWVEFMVNPAAACVPPDLQPVRER
jgi:hypothetical protein